jgi:hypothetical protein
VVFDAFVCGCNPVSTHTVTKLERMRKGVKVRRVVRRFELWPVAKVAFFFHLLCYLLTLAVLTGVWFLADRMGTVKNLEKLISRLGWEKFEVRGDVLFRSAAIIGASLAVVATVATVTLAFFYNMLSGIFGGLVLSVLQRQRRKAAKAQAKVQRKTGNARVNEAVAIPQLPTPQSSAHENTRENTHATHNNTHDNTHENRPSNPFNGGARASAVSEAVPRQAPRGPEVVAEPTRAASVPVLQRAVTTSTNSTARSSSVLYPEPDDWEPDTVKSLFGDGDLDEDFADFVDLPAGNESNAAGYQSDHDGDGGLWGQRPAR